MKYLLKGWKYGGGEGGGGDIAPPAVTPFYNRPLERYLKTT